MTTQPTVFVVVAEYHESADVKGVFTDPVVASDVASTHKKYGETWEVYEFTIDAVPDEALAVLRRRVQAAEDARLTLARIKGGDDA